MPLNERNLNFADNPLPDYSEPLSVANQSPPAERGQSFFARVSSYNNIGSGGRLSDRKPERDNTHSQTNNIYNDSQQKESVTAKLFSRKTEKTSTGENTSAGGSQNDRQRNNSLPGDSPTNLLPGSPDHKSEGRDGSARPSRVQNSSRRPSFQAVNTGSTESGTNAAPSTLLDDRDGSFPKSDSHTTKDDKIDKSNRDRKGSHSSEDGVEFIMASADLHHCSSAKIKRRFSNSSASGTNDSGISDSRDERLRDTGSRDTGRPGGRPGSLDSAEDGIDDKTKREIREKKKREREKFNEKREDGEDQEDDDEGDDDEFDEEGDQFDEEGSTKLKKTSSESNQPGYGRKRSFSIGMFGDWRRSTALPGRRMSTAGNQVRAIDLGAVVKFSRFSFDQFEIRDTDTDSVNPTATQLYGKPPPPQTMFWRAHNSVFLAWGKQISTILIIYNLLFTTFYISFFEVLVSGVDGYGGVGHTAMHFWFSFDLVSECIFVFFECLTPLRTSIVEITKGREYMNLDDIHNILFRRKEYWGCVLSCFSSLLWVDLLLNAEYLSFDPATPHQPRKTGFSFLGLLRFLRFPTLRRERREASGTVMSTTRQGMWAGAELVLCMFFLVHIFAVIWFAVLWSVDGSKTYSQIYADESTFSPANSVFYFYILALRDAVLLFSASPPNHMINRSEYELVLCITMLRPIGALAEAVIFARIVLIEQRVMILRSKTIESVMALNAAMTQIRLPENLHRRINMYHEYLELQHDKRACDLLYQTSSRALVLEIKICLFAQLIEKAPFFRDLKPYGVSEILSNFEEEIFSPGDYIIKFGQDGTEMYFIFRGHCDVVVIRRNSMLGLKKPTDRHTVPGIVNNGFIPDKPAKLVVAQKREGDYFGETALVQKGQKRTAYVRAQTYCVVEKLTAQALHEIVKTKYPEAYNQIVYRISQFHQINPVQVQQNFANPGYNNGQAPITQMNTSNYYTQMMSSGAMSIGHMGSMSGSIGPMTGSIGPIRVSQGAPMSISRDQSVHRDQSLHRDQSIHTNRGSNTMGDSSANGGMGASGSDSDVEGRSPGGNGRPSEDPAGFVSASMPVGGFDTKRMFRQSEKNMQQQHIRQSEMGNIRQSEMAYMRGSMQQDMSHYPSNMQNNMPNRYGLGPMQGMTNMQGMNMQGMFPGGAQGMQGMYPGHPHQLSVQHQMSIPSHGMAGHGMAGTMPGMNGYYGGHPDYYGGEGAGHQSGLFDRDKEGRKESPGEKRQREAAREAVLRDPSADRCDKGDKPERAGRASTSPTASSTMADAMSQVMNHDPTKSSSNTAFEASVKSKTLRDVINRDVVSGVGSTSNRDVIGNHLSNRDLIGGDRSIGESIERGNSSKNLLSPGGLPPIQLPPEGLLSQMGSFTGSFAGSQRLMPMRPGPLVVGGAGGPGKGNDLLYGGQRLSQGYHQQDPSWLNLPGSSDLFSQSDLLRTMHVDDALSGMSGGTMRDLTGMGGGDFTGSSMRDLVGPGVSARELGREYQSDVSKQSLMVGPKISVSSVGGTGPVTKQQSVGSPTDQTAVTKQQSRGMKVLTSSIKVLQLGAKIRKLSPTPSNEDAAAQRILATAGKGPLLTKGDAAGQDEKKEGEET